MDIKVDVKLQAIKIPNYILIEQKVGKRQDGFFSNDNNNKYHVGELSEEVLNALCAEFREGIFEKAREYNNG